MGVRAGRPARLIVLAAVLLAVAVAVTGSWRKPDQPIGAGITGYVDTPSGPLGPADRDVLARVKQAGLWEMPTGEMAADRAQNRRLREIGGNINREHHELDRITEDVAAELGVQLPDQGTAEQRAWVAEIDAADGDEFDRVAVKRMREAHGRILPLIAQIYGTTRNDTIRTFTAEGMVYVSRHISYLESTGLVDHAALDAPPTPQPLLSPVKASYYAAADRPTLILAGLVLIGLVITVFRVAAQLRRRPARPVEPPTVPTLTPARPSRQARHSRRPR
jgi:predicted outer membrane protein